MMPLFRAQMDSCSRYVLSFCLLSTNIQPCAHQTLKVTYVQPELKPKSKTK